MVPWEDILHFLRKEPIKHKKLQNLLWEMCKEQILLGQSLSSWQRRTTQETAKTRNRTSRIKSRIWTWKQFERTIITRQHKNWTHTGFLTGYNTIKCETIDTFNKIKISFYFCCIVIIFINLFKPVNFEENGMAFEQRSKKRDLQV